MYFVDTMNSNKDIHDRKKIVFLKWLIGIAITTTVDVDESGDDYDGKFWDKLGVYILPFRCWGNLVQHADSAERKLLKRLTTRGTKLKGYRRVGWIGRISYKYEL